MNVLHINSHDSGGGSQTVFNFTRRNKHNSQNFSAYIKSDLNSQENSDISFVSWEYQNKFLGICNYIFSFKNYFLLKRFLDNHEIHIIHLHGFFSSLSPSILLAIKKVKKNKKIKIIQTLHDFHLICPNASLFNYSRNNICEKCVNKKIKLNIFFENCDRRGRIYSMIKGIRSLVSNNLLHHGKLIDVFVAPSEFVKNKMIEDGVNSDKLIVLKNPMIQVSEINNDFVSKRNIVCYYGRFSEEKNLDFLIEAFSLWKKKTANDFKLILIGEGEKEHELKAKAMRILKNTDVEFQEYLPFNKLVDVIKTAKYFSMTSKWYENAPMTILEAVTLNIIPIVPDLGGMKESIEIVMKCGKTYTPGDAESWVQIIDYLEQHYTDEINKLLKSKEKVFASFGLDEYLLKISQLYFQLWTK